MTSAPARLAVASLMWLALFSLVFSAGAAFDLWPAGPEGGFHGIDLPAGLLFGAALLLSLIRRRPIPDSRFPISAS